MYDLLYVMNINIITRIAKAQLNGTSSQFIFYNPYIYSMIYSCQGSENG